MDCPEGCLQVILERGIFKSENNFDFCLLSNNLYEVVEEEYQ